MNRRRKKSVLRIICGMQGKKYENALSLAKEVTQFFATHFTMPNVTVYAAHHVGKPHEGENNKRAIVCTVVDARKISIVLESNRVYLKDTPFYVSEDHTPKTRSKTKSTMRMTESSWKSKLL